MMDAGKTQCYVSIEPGLGNEGIETAACRGRRQLEALLPAGPTSTNPRTNLPTASRLGLVSLAVTPTLTLAFYNPFKLLYRPILQNAA